MATPPARSSMCFLLTDHLYWLFGARFKTVRISGESFLKRTVTARMHSWEAHAHYTKPRLLQHRRQSFRPAHRRGYRRESDVPPFSATLHMFPPSYRHPPKLREAVPTVLGGTTQCQLLFAIR